MLLSSILVLSPFTDLAHGGFAPKELVNRGESRYVPPPDPGRASWGPQPPVAPWTLQKLPEKPYALPIIFPLIGNCYFKRSYDLNYGGYRHTGIDIDAPQMTPIVAPFSGVIGFKRDSYWIYGNNGWVTLGTHLNDSNIGTNDHQGDHDLMFSPALVPGQYIHQGELIGYVGESGDATGCHLHFELYKPGHESTESRIVDPYYSLKYGQRITQSRFFYKGQSSEFQAEVRFFGCVRDWNPRSRILIVLLVGKKYPHHSPQALDYPHWIRISFNSKPLSDSTYDPSNGVSQSQVIYCDVNYGGKTDYYTAQSHLFDALPTK